MRLRREIVGHVAARGLGRRLVRGVPRTEDRPATVRCSADQLCFSKADGAPPCHTGSFRPTK